MVLTSSQTRPVLSSYSALHNALQHEFFQIVFDYICSGPAAKAVVYDQPTLHSCTLPFFVKGAFL
jgi:hypothetical protein